MSLSQASVVEAYGQDSELGAYLIVCIFTCRHVAAGGEILWNYGEGYANARERAGYAAGWPCPEGIDVAAPNARVDAILAKGGARVREALYPLTDDSSQESSSGDEWLPVKRVARRA